jgi:hypothetical protein
VLIAAFRNTDVPVAIPIAEDIVEAEFQPRRIGKIGKPQSERQNQPRGNEERDEHAPVRPSQGKPG